ncbi:MAG: C40 family peptidase [Elusimicrobiales bacterium]|jgi:cell wall-associated NlpC family hydrolase|nr:C40 family peptidase [Elusimicrobiales bacterium]
MHRTFTLILAAALSAPAAAGAKSIAQARAEVVDATMVYLNTPYLWGGMHPDTGMDCSAFAKLVYGRAGLELPRVSRDQFAASLRLPPAGVLPGDLVFFAMKNPGTARVDHVGIYVGKGFFVHASFTNGVHIDSVQNPYYYQRLVSVRKYRGF